MQRRTFIGGLSTTLMLGLVGCTGGSSGGGSNGGDGSYGGGGDSNPPDSDGDGVPDRQDDFPNDPEYSQLEEGWLEDLAQIREDQYLKYEFDLNKVTRLEYDFVVRSGPRIDVFTLSPDEFNHYRNDERFRTYSEITFQDTAGESGTTELSAGSYVLVLDNTNIGQAKPPTNFDEDISQVEITIDAAA